MRLDASPFPITSGFFYDGPFAIPSLFLPGATIYIEVKAWQKAYGPTWEQAVMNGAEAGASGVFKIVLGGNSSVPSLYSMPSFAVHPIPEPGTLAIFTLGCLVIAFTKRKASAA